MNDRVNLVRKVVDKVYDLVESKHLASLRGKLPHRDFYARVGSSHAIPTSMSRQAVAAQAKFKQLQLTFDRQLAQKLSEYERLHKLAPPQLKKVRGYPGGAAGTAPQSRTRSSASPTRSGIRSSSSPKGSARSKSTPPVRTKAALNAKAGEIRNLFRDAYNEAYRLGVTTSPGAQFNAPILLSPEELRWLESAVRHENKYFINVLREVLNGRSANSLRHRVKMYADTLESIYFAGQINGQHPDALIYWRMDPAKSHCPDCIELENMSPFTKSTLPCQPRSGATVCLFHCGCRLEYVPGTPAQVAQAKTNNLSKRYLIARLRSKRKP